MMSSLSGKTTSMPFSFVFSSETSARERQRAGVSWQPQQRKNSLKFRRLPFCMRMRPGATFLVPDASAAASFSFSCLSEKSLIMVS